MDVRIKIAQYQGKYECFKHRNKSCANQKFNSMEKR